MTPRQIVRHGIEALYTHFELFSNIAASWEIVETQDVTKTMATDGKRLYYNPDFVAEGSIADCEWVLLHEAGHCFLGHHIRLLDQERGEANIAFDLALNDLIKHYAPSERLRKLMVTPGQGEYYKIPEGKDAEWYWQELYGLKPTPQEMPQDAPDTQGGDQPTPKQEKSPINEPGDNAGQSEEQSGDRNEQGEGEGQDGDGSGEGETSDSTQAQGQSGQGAKGSGQPSTPTSMGEVLPCPDMDGTLAGEAKTQGEWQSVVAETMAVAQMCGNLPGWLSAIGDKLLGRTDTNWKAILRRFLTKSVPVGSNYQMPSRRHGWRTDVIMPARRSKGAGDILIIADTSGSIFGQINETVMPEIEAIVGAMPGCNVTLMQVDTEVRAERKFSRYDFPLRVPADWKGGGGTNLNPGFEACAKQRSKFKACIVATDFLWSYKQAPNPGIPTLWISVGRGDWKPDPAFGQVVSVK